MALVGVVAGVVLLLAVVLVVGGCSGSEAEQPSPSVSGSPGGPSPSGPESSEASPSVGVPVPPSAMRSADEAGAEAFVRHYFALVNHAQATGDLEPLRAVSAAGCAACQGGIRWLEKVARKRWTVEGGEYVLTQPRGQRVDAGRFSVAARVANSAQTIRDADGDVVERFGARKVGFQMVASVTSSGAWQVLSWEYE